MDYSELLKKEFESFCNQYLVPTKLRSGTRLTEIQSLFNQYLEKNNSVISDVSSKQLGLLMSKKFVRRKTNKGAYYLVTIVTHTT